MFDNLIILNCARKQGLSDEDIKKALCREPNPIAARRRNFDIPSHIAVAGYDTHNRCIEILLAEQEDGAFVVYHAMKLTPKMARELQIENHLRR